MKSICNAGLSLCAVTAVALLCPIAANGQTAYTPNVNNVGLPMNGVFSGGSIDSVQLGNGNLHVDIPLLHLPGIGMDTDIHFVYDNQLFNTTTVNYNTVQGLQQRLQISIGRNGFAQVSDPLQGVLKVGKHLEHWQSSVSLDLGYAASANSNASEQTEQYEQQYVMISGCNFNGDLTHLDYMAFTDPDGTGHSFPINGYLYNPLDSCMGTGTPANPSIIPNSYSEDASGYHLVIDQNTGAEISLTDKHGTQYTFGPGGGTESIGVSNSSNGQPINPVVAPTDLTYQQVIKVEDSNGNTISASPCQGQGEYCFTDTAGRTIMESGGPGGLNIGGMTGEANANEPGTISYYDQNNPVKLQTIAINYSTYTLNIPSLCGGNPQVCGPSILSPALPESVSLPTSIVLQNGDTYTLQYLLDGNPDCTPLPNTGGCTLGEISSITLPTGGVISYTWSNLTGLGGGLIGRQVLSRTVTASGQSSTWQYTRSSFPSPFNATTDSYTPTETVTDPNLNDTVYSFNTQGVSSTMNSNCIFGSANLANQETIYSGSQYTGQKIATKSMGYTSYIINSGVGGAGTLPTSNTLTWYLSDGSAKTTETDTAYDNLPIESNCTVLSNSTVLRGNVTSKTVYDYGSGTPGAMLSNTLYSYLHDQNSAYAAKNIADRVSQVSVKNAAGVLVAQTTTAYDNFSSGGQSGLAAAGWTTNHDNTYYGSGNTLRGLPTSVTKYTGPSTATITTYTDYNILGQPTAVTDGNIDGNYNVTENIYSQQSNSLIVTTILPPTGNGVSHVTTKYTDKNTGLLTQQTDFNNNLTYYTYDSRMRPLVTTRPDTNQGTHGSTTNSYPDPNQVRTSVTEDASRTEATTSDLDGLGRTVSVSSVSDAACVFLSVDTTYDLLGRKSAVSNPHCLSAQATDGWTRYTYDAISRLTSKQNPDGTAQTWSFNGNVVNSYDENFNLWTRTYNAESWLTKVLEPAGVTSNATSQATAIAPTLETDYAYDTLGNLITVNQYGGPSTSPGPNGPIYRQFTYDALSRLIASNNPESANAQNPASRTCAGASGTWTTCYGYDNNSNLTGKVDNRGITTTYQYDQLNRLLSKTYSDGTPTVALTYDQPGTNTKGELTSAQAGSGSIMAQRLLSNYDPMGRILSEQQCTPANCPSNTSSAQQWYSLGYQYDLTGFVTQSTNSAGMYSATSPGYQPLILTNTPDIAERLTAITSNWSDAYHPSTLFQASTGSVPYGYGPMGLQDASLGVNSLNGITTGTLYRDYDNRGRTVFEADTAPAPTSTPSPITTTDSTGSITISGTGRQLTESSMGGVATFTVNGYEYTHNGDCLDPQSATYNGTTVTWCGGQYQQVPNTGYVIVTITTPTDSYTAYGSYGASTDTPTTVASSLASAFNSMGSPAGSIVTAASSGNVVTVQAIATGPPSDYSYTITCGGSNGCDFMASGSNVTASPYYAAHTFVNGTWAGTYYDHGDITATISGTPVTVSYGACSTPSTIAASLSSAINAEAGSFVSATASGPTVSLQSKQGGYSTDWSLSTEVTWDQYDFCRISTCPPLGYCQPASCVPSYTVDVTSGTGTDTTTTSSGDMTGGGDSFSSVVYYFMIPNQDGFDPAGNLLNVQDSVMGNWSYSYDNLNRLTTGSANLPSGAQQHACWKYDAFGNRTMQNLQSSSCSSQSASTWVYGVNNQVTGVIAPGGTSASPSPLTYDQAGDVQNDTVTGNSYRYDAEGRLCAVSSPSGTGGFIMTGYFYDAMGTRVAKGSLSSFSCNFASNGFTPTTSYVLGLGGEQITELSVSGTAGSYLSAWKHANVFGGLGLAATYSLTGSSTAPTSTYFALNDWLGTKRAEVGTIVGSNGSPQPCVSTFSSLPYGDGLTPGSLAGYATCADATEHHFTGKERDIESGNDYFGARYDSSAMGRFLSPDPSMDSVALRNPQTWNRYSYTLNNPLKFIDPTGMCWVAAPSGVGTYDWMSSPNSGQTCYDAVATSNGSTLTMYGSNNAQDITKLTGNDHGMIDLQDISAQHDAGIDVKQGDYTYVNAQTGANFFNFLQDYQSNYPDAPNLVVTEAGSWDGSLVPGHLSHRDGKQIDLRYVDDNGKPIQGATADRSADADRMWDVFRGAQSAGFSQIYLGDEEEWGDFGHIPKPPADQHESHFHLSIPNPRPPSK
jgi:RHS repeat-associated protein